MNWVHQIQKYQLGNFIMMTPAIKALSMAIDDRVPVYFDTLPLATIFRDCPFMKILVEKPDNDPLFTSDKPARKETESDYEAYFRINVAEKFPDMQMMPHPYVDQPRSQRLTNEQMNIGIFHGSLSIGKMWEKIIPLDVLQYMIDAIINAGMNPVLIGNRSDRDHFWSKVNTSRVENNFLSTLTLRESIGVLAECDGFISNDTGLYHAAGAMHMHGIVLWEKTNFIRLRSPCAKIQHSRSTESHRENIDNFLNATKERLQ
jgi:ADP-heptose:LPS heptosyltransferase